MGAGSGGGGGGGGGVGGGFGGGGYNDPGPAAMAQMQQQGLLWSPNFNSLFPNAGQNWPGQQQNTGGANLPGFPPNYTSQNQNQQPSNMWRWDPQFNDWQNMDVFMNPSRYGVTTTGPTAYQQGLVTGYPAMPTQPAGPGSAAGYLQQQGF